MKFKKLLGAFIVSLPFVAIFATIVFFHGLLAAFYLFGSVLFLVAILWIGVELLFGD